MATAAGLGLCLAQEPCVFVSALTGGAFFAMSSARGRSALGLAWRDHRIVVVGSFAAGLAPLALALVRRRLNGPPVGGTGVEAWGPPGASPLAFVHREIGDVLTVLAAAGLLAAGLTKRSRPAAAGLGAVVATGLVCGWMGASMGPTRFAAPALAAEAAMCALAGVSMLVVVRAVAATRVPLARTAAGLFVVLELVIPVEGADDALVRGALRTAGTVAWWDDAVWGPLEPRTVVLIGGERGRARAAAARAQGLLRSDVVLMGGRWKNELQGGPSASDLVPLWRDLALSGSPGEASLSALASARPVVASYDPAWGSAIGRHLVPMELLDRVEPEPRGASDRRRALDAFASARQQLSGRLADDPELCAATVSLLQARAVLLASIGDRDLAARCASDIRLFGGP
jgi:hypothetical protein